MFWLGVNWFSGCFWCFLVDDILVGLLLVVFCGCVGVWFYVVYCLIVSVVYVVVWWF